MTGYINHDQRQEALRQLNQYYDREQEWFRGFEAGRQHTRENVLGAIMCVVVLLLAAWCMSPST